LYDLTMDDKHKEVRIPVECTINMYDKLMAPNIKFGINIPNDDYKIESQVNSLGTDDLNKQFLSLLVINRFQPLVSGFGTRSEARSQQFSGIRSNAGELLTSQLSHWLSQISDNFDIGVNYRASDSLSTSELEVALSTQILNDRMRINGNVNMGGQHTNTSNFVGEFDLEYKITKTGRLRVKYYTKANDNITSYGTSPYKQGLGLFYRKEFNNFNELFKKDIEDQGTNNKKNKEKKKDNAILNEQKKKEKKENLNKPPGNEKKEN
jgi:hypothetical protein